MGRKRGGLRVPGTQEGGAAGGCSQITLEVGYTDVLPLTIASSCGWVLVGPRGSRLRRGRRWRAIHAPKAQATNPVLIDLRDVRLHVILAALAILLSILLPALVNGAPGDVSTSL